MLAPAVFLLLQVALAIEGTKEGVCARDREMEGWTDGGRVGTCAHTHHATPCVATDVPRIRLTVRGLDGLDGSL